MQRRAARCRARRSLRPAAPQGARCRRMLVHANQHSAARAGHRRPGAGTPPRPLCRRSARLGDGRWYVLADHTGSALGIGYAFRDAARFARRSSPEAFRPVPIRICASFVDRWHDFLPCWRWRWPMSTQPNMAVRHPAPCRRRTSNTSISSRSFGVPLVEGGDLVARDGQVTSRLFWPAPGPHVLLCRLNSAFADPLNCVRRFCAGHHRHGRGDARNGRTRARQMRLKHPSRRRR